MLRCDDAASAEQKSGISRRHHVRVRDRVDFIQSDDLRVATEAYFIPSANNIQMTDPRMIADAQHLHTDDEIPVTDADIVSDLASFGVENAQADTHPLPDPIAEDVAVTGALEKRGQHRYAGENY
jgi:hypothetical protein